MQFVPSSEGAANWPAKPNVSPLSVYSCERKLCCEYYEGRSTWALQTRVGEHCRSFDKFSDNLVHDQNLNEFALGASIGFDHILNHRDDFDYCSSISILDWRIPINLHVRELKYIQSLTNSLSLNNLNFNNIFSISLFYLYFEWK